MGTKKLFVRSSPVRVLHLGSPSGLFGAERWILALIKHLSNESIQTVVGVIDDGMVSKEPPLYQAASELGFESLVIRAPGRVNYKAIFQLREEIKNRNIDILHTHYYKPTIISALATLSSDCQFVATPHGWSGNAGASLFIYQWMERFAFVRAAAVAPLSPALEKELKKLPWLRQERVRLILNAVDLSEVNSIGSNLNNSSDFKRVGTFSVGYIGQLISRKRVDILLRAFSELDIENKHLYILGEGSLRYQLEELANNLGIGPYTSFMGFRGDRLEYLRAFDVLVLPSVLEGIPRCLMESMALGVAVIGSRISGITDLITHEETGLLFAPRSHVELKLNLERLHADDLFRQSLAERGRLRVHQLFSAQAMAVSYERLYREIHISRLTAGVMSD